MRPELVTEDPSAAKQIDGLDYAYPGAAQQARMKPVSSKTRERAESQAPLSEHEVAMPIEYWNQGAPDLSAERRPVPLVGQAKNPKMGSAGYGTVRQRNNAMA